MNGRWTPARAIAFVLLLLQILLFSVVLPPRQTADLVGAASALGAHILVSWAWLQLLEHGRGLLRIAGIGVTLVLYWLAALGSALLFRLLHIASYRVLAALELAYVLVAALLCYLFWVAGQLEDNHTTIKKWED